MLARMNGLSLGIGVLDARVACDVSKRADCQEPGCVRTTKEGKPYCPDHISRLPYIAHLMQEVERGAFDGRKQRAAS